MIRSSTGSEVSTIIRLVITHNINWDMKGSILYHLYGQTIKGENMFNRKNQNVENKKSQTFNFQEI